MKFRILVFSLFTLTAPLPAVAQDKKRALTNDDIRELCEKQIDPDFIVAMILATEKNAFDLSPDVAIELSGKCENSVLKAMAGVGDSDKDEVGVTLRDGTDITVLLRKPISSASARINDRVEFEAKEDVLADGMVVIKKRALAWGKVILARRKKSFGRSGKLDFTIEYVEAVNGQNVRLRTTQESRGANSYGAAGVVTLLFGPFGAFVKGKNVKFEVDHEFPIFIDGDRKINLNDESFKQ